MDRQTSLSKNMVQFCRYLRQENFSISAEEEATALDALQFIDLSNAYIFQLTLKSVLCKDQNALKRFDDLYRQYWQHLHKAVNAKSKNREKSRSKATSTDAFKALKSWLNGNRSEETEHVATYSFHETLSQKDFSNIPEDDLNEMLQTIKAISKRLAAQLKRRYQHSLQIKLPDLKKTVRRNMRHGGELIDIAYRKPKPNRTKLVVLCDVSQSMNLYTKFLLQFMYSFQQVYRRIETFAFGTSLEHLTPLLKRNEFNNLLQLLSANTNTWAGGTRIGESLQQFTEDYAKAIDKRTVVIVLSDGWDTGNIDLLKESMSIIRNKSKKIIWLNPLAGNASYQPTVAGMQAAMPYIDVFQSAHNIDSLRKLIKWW